MAFTKLYLTTGTAPYTPATIRGAWDDSAGAVTRALDTTKNHGGAFTTIGRAETNAAANWDVLLYRGVSGPLAAQTISGTLDVVLGVVQSTADADLAFHIHVYVTQGDSDTVRGTLLTNYVEVVANEWPTTATGRALAAAQALTNIGAITAGDRLVVEIGYVALNATASSRTGTLHYGTLLSTGVAADDLSAAGTDVTVKAGFITFSVSIDEGTLNLRESQAVIEALDGGSPELRESQAVLEVLEALPVDLRVSQAVVEVLEMRLPDGGGLPGGGTNPANGNLPTSLPLVFVYVKLLDGTVLRWAEAWGRLNDPATWFGGEKENRILALSSIKTEFSEDGAPKTYTWTVDLNDKDGALRTAARTNTLKGAYIAAYVVDDAVRRAFGTPYRYAAGVVTTHTLSEPMRCSIKAEGALGRKLGMVNRQPKVPNHLMTAAEYPGLDNRREGMSVHVPLGLVSDEGNASPEGVVPWLYTGTNNLQVFCGGGAVSVQVDAYLLAEGAMGWILNSYFTPPEWGDEEVQVVGDLVKPADDTAYLYTCTIAGTTGTSEPTWPTGVGATVVDGSVTWTRGAVLNPLTRYLLPPAGYGSVVAMPFKPGWTAATGLTTNYVDYGTPPRRFTPAFVLHSHRYARALREGRIRIATNGIGLMTAADGTGLYFSDPVLQAQWVLVNEGFASIDYTAYAAIPTFDAPEGTYSIIDTASVDAAKAIGDGWLAGGIIGGFLLGRDGQQQRLFDCLRELSAGGLFKIGENRHGQIIFHRHNSAATPVVTYEAWEVIDGSVNCWLDDAHYANHIRHFSAYRYEQQAGAASTPTTTWANAIIQDEDATAQAAVGETVTRDVENYGIRDTASVAALIDQDLAVSVGPAATMDGCPMMSFSLRWTGLGKGGVSVDLGTCIRLTHPEARKTTAQTMVVEGREVDGLGGKVRLTCRIIEA